MSVRSAFATAVGATVLIALGGCSDGGGSAEPAAPASIATTITAAATLTVPDTTAVPETTTTAGSAVPPFDHETVTLPLVDTTRTTTGLSGEVVPSRSLPTTLYLPTTDEPVPLIVFSHGFGASPAKFERLFAAWATAGYAVAAPAFPLTSDLVDGAERVVGDVANQPADVLFVLDQVLASEFGERIDASRLAAAGLSLGGLTTYLAAIDEATRDPRFVAAMVLAAVPPGESFTPHGMPVMVMHGELDPVVPVTTADAAFASLPSPAYEVTLLGAFHAEAFEDEEENQVFPDRERYHPVVDATTTAFWDTHLLADPTAAPRIAESGDVAGLTRFAAR